MKTKLFAALALSAAFATFSSTSHAATISGSESFAAAVDQTGVDLSTRETYTVSGFVSSGTGDLMFVPGVGTLVSTNTFDLTGVTPGNSAFTGLTFLANGAYSFTSDHAYITSRTATSLILFVTGELTPSGVLSAFSAGTASLRFAFTADGGSVGSTVTLASPAEAPPSVPEPVSMALIGTGLVGLGLARRRKV